MMNVIQLNKPAMTIRQLLQASSLTRSNSRRLLSHLLGWSNAQLLSRDEQLLTPLQLATYQAWQDRLMTGEPLAYIVGYQEFYSRRFQVSPATLIPRPETELLVELAITLAPRGATLVDCGTGSGCIAVTLKLERPDLNVIALDYSEAALQIAQANASCHGAAIRWLQSDWLSQLEPQQEINMIVANPPYIDANDPHLAALGHEPLTALTDGSDGLSCLRQLSSQASKRLTKGGWLIMEHGYDQGAAVRALLSQAGFSQVQTRRDYAGHDRISLGHN